MLFINRVVCFVKRLTTSPIHQNVRLPTETLIVKAEKRGENFIDREGMSSRVAAGLEGPDRILFCGHPSCFTETKIRELLESFGPLRALNLSKDKATGIFKGFGSCAYQDPSVTDIACDALHNTQIGDKKLAVRRAIQRTIQPEAEQELKIAMQRLMIGSNEIQPQTKQELEIALQRLMLQP